MNVVCRGKCYATDVNISKHATPLMLTLVSTLATAVPCKKHITGDRATASAWHPADQRHCALFADPAAQGARARWSPGHIGGEHQQHREYTGITNSSTTCMLVRGPRRSLLQHARQCQRAGPAGRASGQGQRAVPAGRVCCSCCQQSISCIRADHPAWEALQCASSTPRSRAPPPAQ
jgi:hypothetical protein